MSLALDCMSAPDFYSHRSDRERKIDSGVERGDSDEGEKEKETEDEYSEDEDDFSHSTPFCSRVKNQFTPNAEAFRDPLKSRRSLSKLSATTNVKIEASGVLTLLHTFDINELYERLKRSKRSETCLTIMSCQFSPKKDSIALALSTGEIEVVQYDSEQGDLRICYTLIDKDVNMESVNCTVVQWMPDNKRLFATYTNGFIKLWHVSSKIALLSKNENEHTTDFNYDNTRNNQDLLKDVFNKYNTKNKTDKRQILCMSQSRSQVSVDLNLCGANKYQSAAVTSTTNDSASFTPTLDPSSYVPSSTEAPAVSGPIHSTHTDLVTIVATGGSDGVIIVWFLHEPTPTSQSKTASHSNKSSTGRQLLFHLVCVHGGSKTKMDGHKLKIFAVCFDPKQPNHFFSGGWDGMVFKWDAITGECLSSVKGPLMCSNESMNLDLDSGKPFLLCADHGSGYVDVMNYSSNSCLNTETRILMPSDRFVMPYACIFFGLDKILIGGSNSNCVRIIDRKVDNSNKNGFGGDGGGALTAANENFMYDAKSTELMRPKNEGDAIVYGSVDDLPFGVTSIDLGPEDRLKKQLIAVTSGSLIMFLNSTIRR